MIVDELLAELSQLFPAAFSNQRTAEAWRRQYVAVLGNLPSDVLHACWIDTMASWTQAGCPKPAAFLANVRGHAVTRQVGADGASPTIQAIRQDGFRRHGLWLESWGDRPALETEQDRAKRHRDWMEKFGRETRGDKDIYRALITRVRAGESPTELLREIWSGGRSQRMSLYPDERLSDREKSRRRDLSLGAAA